jgi:signal peptidase I
MKKSVPREYFESLVIAVILALFVRTWVFQAFKIPTGSMETGLLVGDHLIVNKMIFPPTLTGVERAILPRRDVRRGDVIVFKYPEEPERDFIKRVIGLPGDRLELRRKKVFINGQPLDEPYAQFLEPETYVKGKALFIYFSFEENGSVANLFSDIAWGRILNRVR